MVKAQANTFSVPLTLCIRYLWSLLTLTLSLDYFNAPGRAFILYLAQEGISSVRSTWGAVPLNKDGETFISSKAKKTDLDVDSAYPVWIIDIEFLVSSLKIVQSSLI